MKPGDLFFVTYKSGVGLSVSLDELNSSNNYTHVLVKGDVIVVLESHPNKHAMDAMKVLTRFGVLWIFAVELRRVTG